MRVRYLSQYYPPEPGAPASRVSQLSRCWVSAGHSVEVVTGFPNHPTGELPPEYRGRVVADETDQGVHVLRNWLWALPNGGKGIRLLGQGSYALSASTLGLARAAPADVIIATHPSIFTGWAGLVHAKAQRIPLVLEVRDLWPQLFIETGMIKNPALIAVLQRVEMALYESADFIVTVTSRFKEIITRKGIPADRIAVIHNGVDLASFTPRPGEREEVRRQWGLDGKFVVSYVGTLGLLHGLDTLIRVAARMAGDPAFHFLLVGEGADRRALEQQTRDLGLRNVTFAGLQPFAKVRGFYEATDLAFVGLTAHPFLLENFIPSKIFEILACGTPILCTLGGETADILRGSGLSTFAKAGDEAAIEAAIRAAAAAPPDEAAREGARVFVRRFERSVLAERYLAILRDVVARGIP